MRAAEPPPNARPAMGGKRPAPVGGDYSGLHHWLRAMLANAAQYPAVHTVPLEVLRAKATQWYTTPAGPVAVGSIEDRQIEGPAGPLNLRIYRPKAESPLPIIMFFHGGGFVMCNLDTYNPICSRLCATAECMVVSVDYRLAPENPFPAAPDDCLAATRWTFDNARKLGGDPSRMGLAGDSAGGNLAAVTAMRLRDEGGPQVRAQLLVYPALDVGNFATASYAKWGAGFGLDRDTIQWFWNLYLSRPDDGLSCYAAPMKAVDLSGLPATYILSAKHDVLCDEAALYAGRLRAAGVPVTLQEADDMNHGFLYWVGALDRATQALEMASTWLKANLRSTSPG